VSKDKEVWFIVGLGVFIIAVIAAALVGIKYARTCLLGDKAAAPKPQKVAPRQGATPPTKTALIRHDASVCPQLFCFLITCRDVPYLPIPCVETSGYVVQPPLRSNRAASSARVASVANRAPYAATLTLAASGAAYGATPGYPPG
jgi:hypothetical protein